MGKILNFQTLCKESHRLRLEGKSIALVTGCFDILHIGHIHLFKFAKSKSDIVILGLDNDASIKTSKGANRPVHPWKIRSLVLSEIKSIDYIFKFNKVVNFNSPEADTYYHRLAAKLRPHYIVTNSVADKFWQKKKHRAKSIGATLLVDRHRRKTSSTSIIKKLEEEL